MIIDKFNPRQLNTDDDQRLLSEGDMVDAVNVSVQEDGNGTAGILKNVRGTRATTYSNLNDVIPTNALTVIGSVSDSQRGRVYFFAANVAGSGNDYIYMLDTNTDQYQIVFQTPSTANGFLNFDVNSFIKADVVNRDFSRDGNLESVLYFTDNINPPRKINVDRALNGDYDGFNFLELDFMLNSVKAAPTREPDFVFDTDTGFKQNNFQGRCFQFATQFIYSDGEESAVSPYSGLAFTDEALETQSDTQYAPLIYSALRFESNVIDINTKFVTGSNSAQPLNPSADIPDVVEIRVLARENNNGAWFIVDEVPVREDTQREVNGTQVTVYNGATGIYRWYNNGGYRTMPSLVTDKLFDNVPLLARGQAISGNRLVYSNYDEGYDNAVDPNVNITVNYLNGTLFSSDQDTTATNAVTWITEDVTGVTSSVSDDGSIRVDFVQAFDGANDSTYALNANSVTTLTLNWNPEGSLSIDSSSVVEFQGIDSDGSTVGGKYSPAVFDDAEDKYWGVYFTYTANEGDTVADLSNAFANWVNDQQWSYTFVNETTQIDEDSNVDNSTHSTFPFILSDADHTVGWRFQTVSTGGNVYIQPYIYVYTINHDDLYQTNETGGGGQFDPEGSLDDGWWQIETQSDNVSPITYQHTSGHNYTFTNTTVTDITFVSNSVNTIPTFKHGATHEFAVMYYDKYNRNGPLMKIGSTYVQHPAERAGGVGLGPASVSFDFNHDAPDWAESYKILYPGNSSFSSVWNGAVQNAFVEYHREDHGAYTGYHVAENKRHIYVSLEGVEELSNEYGVRTSYDFSEGDILRVLSYNNDGTENQLASSSNGTAPIVEFKVVKTVTLESNDDNPLIANATEFGSVPKEKTGRFVVVEAPWIDGSVEGPNGNQIQYHGFDWFSLTNTDYPYNNTTGTQVQSSGENRWKKECVVEILTPINISERSVYYEISDYIGVGDRRNAGAGETNHGPVVTVTNGDTFFRPVLSSVNLWSGSEWLISADDRMVRTITMESDRYSDFRERADWGQGRPHLALTEEQNRRRYNGLMYSEALVDDLNTNYLSSFDKNQVNYFDLSPSFGAVNYIGALGEQMIAIQENKVSRIRVDRNTISNADGSDALIGLSSLPFNIDIYFSGDYGCGDSPESVLIQDNQVFFADPSRSRILRLASSQLYPISEKKTSSLFEDRFETFNNYNGQGRRIVSGYDPHIDRYYVTFLMGGNSDTVGYDVFGGRGGEGRWVSRYSFYPTNYANQNNLMYSCLWNDPNNENDFDQQLFWAHDADQYNTFHGQVVANSVVEYVSKKSPSEVKVFDAISYEGSSNLWEVTTITTNLNARAGALDWVEKEGSYYAYITRDENGTKHITSVGTVDSAGPQSITFQNKVNNIPIPANANLLVIDTNGSSTDISTNTNEVQVASLTNAFTIATLADNVDYTNLNTGDQIVAETVAAADSDPVRGHWAQIRMVNNLAVQHELFCINTVITPSPMYHTRGQ